jgi:hypothetical protein
MVAKRRTHKKKQKGKRITQKRKLKRTQKLKRKSNKKRTQKRKGPGSLLSRIRQEKVNTPPKVTMVEAEEDWVSIEPISYSMVEELARLKQKNKTLKELQKVSKNLRESKTGKGMQKGRQENLKKEIANNEKAIETLKATFKNKLETEYANSVKKIEQKLNTKYEARAEARKAKAEARKAKAAERAEAREAKAAARAETRTAARVAREAARQKRKAP